MGFNLTTQDYPHYTYKDYEKWEGDWELIRGIPYAMSPSPKWQHQGFGGRFVKLCLEALEKNQNICNCEVLYESDWIVSDDTVVRPDVMIVCEPIKGDHVTEPPSLILEILSPSTILKDRNTKLNLYKAYGVKFYLMADLGKRIIEVLELKGNRYEPIANTPNFQLTKECTIQLALQDLFNA